MASEVFLAFPRATPGSLHNPYAARRPCRPRMQDSLPPPPPPSMSPPEHELRNRAKAAKLRAKAAKARVRAHRLEAKAKLLSEKATHWEERADELDGVVRPTPQVPVDE